MPKLQYSLIKIHFTGSLTSPSPTGERVWGATSMTDNREGGLVQPCYLLILSRKDWNLLKGLDRMLWDNALGRWWRVRPVKVLLCPTSQKIKDKRQPQLQRHSWPVWVLHHLPGRQKQEHISTLRCHSLWAYLRPLWSKPSTIFDLSTASVWCQDVNMPSFGLELHQRAYPRKFGNDSNKHHT